MSIIDLAFPVLATEHLPADHGYHLYAALTRLLPVLHESNGIGVHPIVGRMIGGRQMQLAPFSRLILRAPAESIGALLPLSGKQLRVADRNVRVGVPQVYPLRGDPTLLSRLVTIKFTQCDRSTPIPPDATGFLAAARRQLDALDVSGEIRLTLGKRRTLRIKDKEIVGYQVTIAGLSESESLTIQTQGLGGRRHMGCGVFAPCRNREV